MGSHLLNASISFAYVLLVPPPLTPPTFFSLDEPSWPSQNLTLSSSSTRQPCFALCIMPREQAHFMARSAARPSPAPAASRPASTYPDAGSDSNIGAMSRPASSSSFLLAARSTS